MYKRCNPSIEGAVESSIIRLNDGASIPFDPANTDYQTFKAQINTQTASLLDNDGNAMSADEAKQFVSTLP